MIAEYSQKSNKWAVWVAVGIVGRIAVAFIPGSDALKVALMVLVTVFALVSLLLAIRYYAQAKGYSPWLGLFGLLGLIGIIIVAVMPDLKKSSPAASTPEGSELAD
ncbi:MAG TPA: hypothetical protein VGK34_09645 [Armatimonadota bacterium]|jgi:ABC-type transport system involved in cytochrome c biogenesis permease subunit